MYTNKHNFGKLLIVKRKDRMFKGQLKWKNREGERGMDRLIYHIICAKHLVFKTCKNIYDRKRNSEKFLIDTSRRFISTSLSSQYFKIIFASPPRRAT